MAPLIMHKAVLAFLLLCSGVVAQEPFVWYNTSIPLSQQGFVRWDVNAFAGPVNLWLQELAPNASAPQVPLDYANTKGFFLWTAGSNLSPGQYFYQLQSVGGQGIIFKSNPILVICSECPATSSALPPLTSADAAVNPTDGPLPGETAPADPTPSKENGLSTGAAAGIGVGGALGAVALLALAFFLFWRSRKQKQSANQPPPNGALSTHHPSLNPASPPPKFSSYEESHEAKPGYSDSSPMSIAPNYGRQHGPSHELESARMRSGPNMGAYQSQSESLTPNRFPSPASAGVVAPQPRSPPLGPLTSSGLQYQQRSQGQTSPPAMDHRTPGSNQEAGSYGFPSQETPSDPDFDAFHFQQHPPPPLGAGSPDNQQHYPRRTVGTPRGGPQ